MEVDYDLDPPVLRKLTAADLTWHKEPPVIEPPTDLGPLFCPHAPDFDTCFPGIPQEQKRTVYAECMSQHPKGNPNRNLASLFVWCEGRFRELGLLKEQSNGTT